MLPADHRLRDSDAFRETVRRGHRAGSSALVVHVGRTPVAPVAHRGAPGAARIGFVVSRAVGNAVVRNRVKRRLRHLMRGHLGQVPSGVDMVVRALPPAATLTWAELDAELVRCLERVRRRRPRDPGSAS